MTLNCIPVMLVCQTAKVVWAGVGGVGLGWGGGGGGKCASTQQSKVLYSGKLCPEVQTLTHF